MGNSIRAVIAATSVGLVACSGGESDEAFCTSFQDASDMLTELAEAQPEDIGQLADELNDINPPADIEEPYDRLVDTYRQLAQGDALTDPSLAAQLSEAQANLERIEAFLAENCRGTD